MQTEGDDRMANAGAAMDRVTVAAHELKAPLALIRQLTLQIEEFSAAQTQTAKTKNAGLNQTAVHQIQLTAERALRLTDSLTKRARLDDAMFACEPLILQNVCRAAITEMRPLLRARNLTIETPRLKRTKPAVANRDLTRLILTNLLDNAAAHARARIGVQIHETARDLVIEVRDDGAPLELHEWRQLHDNLGQAQPLSARPLSSGLGLQIAQEFARAMQGDLTLRRHARGGLSFLVTIPAVRQLSLLEI
jgi:signal transduction histidine kinase